MDKNRMAVDIFDKLAEHYQQKFMGLGLYHETFDLFCNQVLTKNARILELACGPGNITQYLLQKRPDFIIHGIDLSPNMVKLARLNNPQAKFDVMDCRLIAALQKKYDAVMCGFGLPYLSQAETRNLIRDVALLLNASGVIYISTMEDDYSKSGWKKSSSGESVYMHYHRAEFLVNLLEKNNFTVTDLKRQDYPEQDGTKTTDLIVIARK